MQVSAGFQSNQQLQYQMQADKSQCTCTVRDLEARLLDVQDRLMQKVREVTAAREVQTSLRTEIESYKALIECQEKKYVLEDSISVSTMELRADASAVENFDTPPPPVKKRRRAERRRRRRHYL